MSSPDRKGNGDRKAPYEWSHKRIIAEIFPEGEMPEWTTESHPLQIYPKASIRTVADSLSLLAQYDKDMRKYNKLRIKPNKSKEEKEEMERLDAEMLTPEGLLSGMFNSFVTHYNNMTPSIDGKRADQGIQVATSMSGTVKKKKKQGLISRLLGRKPEFEMQPTLQTAESGE